MTISPLHKMPAVFAIVLVSALGDWVLVLDDAAKSQTKFSAP